MLFFVVLYKSHGKYTILIPDFVKFIDFPQILIKIEVGYLTIFGNRKFLLSHYYDMEFQIKGEIIQQNSIIKV